MGLDVEAGRRRLLVVDAQVERCDRARTVECELDRHAAACVNMAVTTPPCRAGCGVADEDRTVRQAGPGLAGGGAVELKPLI